MTRAPSEFGVKLRALRRRLDMSLASVARAASLTQQRLRDVERGRRDRVPHDRLPSLCLFLRLSEAEAADLILAWARQGKAYPLKPDVSSNHDRLAARLVRSWDSLTREEVTGMLAFLGGALDDSVGRRDMPAETEGAKRRDWSAADCSQQCEGSLKVTRGRAYCVDHFPNALH